MKSNVVLLTLVELQICFEIILKLDGKDSQSVDCTIHKHLNRTGEDLYEAVARML